MFANRLTKNIRRLRSWAEREGVTCYRLYDADMPEYAFAIDLYRACDTEESWLYVQEYAAPAEIELEAVRRRRGEVLASLPEVAAVPPSAFMCAPGAARRVASSIRKWASASACTRSWKGACASR